MTTFYYNIAYWYCICRARTIMLKYAESVAPGNGKRDREKDRGGGGGGEEDSGEKRCPLA